MPSRHHRTTLSGCMFATDTCIDIRKKNLLNSSTSSTCPDNMVNFVPLTAEIGSGVCCTPANFIGFSILAALLHGTLVVGVGKTLRRWTLYTPNFCSLKIRRKNSNIHAYRTPKINTAMKLHVLLFQRMKTYADCIFSYLLSPSVTSFYGSPYA